ncbi:hypothetical protein Ndes2526B_g06604 [Nannochloris sp. 'desiccata']
MPPASRPRNDTLLLISHLLAAALGHWLWSHKTEIAATTASVADFIADFILDQLEWFMTAKPAGIKLHLQLAHALGLGGMKYINILQSISSALPTVELIELAVMAAAVALPLVGLGTSKCTGIATQCCYLLIAPITVAYTTMTLIYRLHLNATMHTWLAMRGKTPLVPSSSFRKGKAGTESSEKKRPSAPQPLYPTQLAVASLLFMPCILTLPTTAWFYAFWSAVELVCYGLPASTASVCAGGAILPDNTVNLLHTWAQGHVFTLK